MSALRDVDIAEFFPPARREQFQNCILTAPEPLIERIQIRAPDTPGLRRDYRIRISDPAFRGQLKFLLGPGTGTVDIDTAGPANLSIRMWRTASLRIGARTTITDARIVADHADISIGEDGLWSDEILVQSNDQHGIIDLATGRVINGGRRHVTIGDHVWVGRRVTLMPDIAIGAGALLAAGAVLTSDMDPNTIYAGVPARKIREGVTWSRSPGGFSDFERDFLGIE